MKISEIAEILERLAPSSEAEEWDNCGLNVGSLNRECTGVILALDLTADVAAQAAAHGCNLIITHHPLIFNAIRKIDTDKADGAIIETLLKNGFTAYAAHTNLDKSQGGLNSKLAELFGGEDAHIDGIGVLFSVKPTPLDEFARKIAYKLADKTVKVSGNPDALIERVYVISGGGASSEEYEKAKTVANVFVTGDIKHHIFTAAANDNFPVVEFSHYSSEIIAADIICNAIKPACGNLKIIKAIQHCPYRTLEEI